MLRLCAFVAIALLGAGGCQDRAASPAPAAPAAPDALVNRVWVRADSSDLPGRKLIFLSDGTLVQDSCWETYRLSKWLRAASTRVTWVEDTQTIQAEIRSLSENELVLRLLVPDDPQEQRFTPASAPYVCPDMKR